MEMEKVLHRAPPPDLVGRGNFIAESRDEHQDELALGWGEKLGRGRPQLPLAWAGQCGSCQTTRSVYAVVCRAQQNRGRMVDSIACSIRKATKSDSSGILRCLSAAFEQYQDKYTSAGYLDTVLTPESVASRLEEMFVFVAADESGQIVGTVACNIIRPDEGHVRGMAVLPAWHGAGVAARLLKCAESRLRECNCKRVSLDTTEPLQRAIHFYEKNGFRRSGKVRDFFGMPLFEYVKRLSAKDSL